MFKAVFQVHSARPVPKPKRLFSLSVICSALLFAQPSWSQETTSAPTLDQVLQSVLNKQPEKKLLSGYAELANQYQTTASAWFPDGAQMNVRHENDGLTDDTGFESWETGVAFPVGLEKQRKAYRQLGASYQVQTQAYQRFLGWQASALTRDLVWSLKGAEVAWHRSQQNYGLVASLVSKVQTLVEAGESPAMDLVLAQKEALNAEKQVLQAHSRYQQQLARYRYWSGLSLIPDDLSEPSVANMPSVAVALDNHPQMQWAQSRLEQTQAGRLLAEADALQKPELFIGGKSERDDQTAARTSLMVEMRFPLGRPARYQTVSAEQNQQIRQQQAEIEKIRQRLENQIRQSSQTLEQSQALLQVAQQQVNLSKEALKTAEKAYEVGETNIQTLLQVQSQMLQALLEQELEQVAVERDRAFYRQALGMVLSSHSRSS